MPTAHNRGNKSLVHVHLKPTYIRPIRPQPPKQDDHTEKDQFSRYNIGLVSTHQFCNFMTELQAGSEITGEQEQQSTADKQLAKG